MNVYGLSSVLMYILANDSGTLHGTTFTFANDMASRDGPDYCPVVAAQANVVGSGFALIMIGRFAMLRSARQLFILVPMLPEIRRPNTHARATEPTLPVFLQHLESVTPGIFIFILLCRSGGVQHQTESLSSTTDFVTPRTGALLNSDSQDIFLFIPMLLWLPVDIHKAFVPPTAVNLTVAVESGWAFAMSVFQRRESGASTYAAT
ncbi:hypothetical protein BKA82DRAFT_4009470 [Pisolithus tinctorius]|nr:hypothetical protein BKA82DRAFT_4009470 [Pisolithus tinctorius]